MERLCEEKYVDQNQPTRHMFRIFSKILHRSCHFKMERKWQKIARNARNINYVLLGITLLRHVWFYIDSWKCKTSALQSLRINRTSIARILQWWKNYTEDTLKIIDLLMALKYYCIKSYLFWTVYKLLWGTNFKKELIIAF